MFFTYLARELRRRMRQALFIALGLALGIGLVITVTAASAGVRSAQAKVLHSLYGVGTDITVSQAPAAGSGGPAGFKIGGRPGSGTRPKAGTHFTRDVLVAPTLGAIKASSLAQISRLAHVSAVSGVLNLTDLRVSGKIPSQQSGGFVQRDGGGGPANVSTSSFGVEGVNPAAGKLGPLSSGTLASGRTFTSADADSFVALVTASYAHQHKLKTGSKITVGGKKFTVAGIVSVPAADSSSDIYIPLARAQALAGMKNEVNTIYVSADSATNISAVAREISSVLPKATVTTSSDLAKEVTGSIGSAASLASNLGRWLAVAVLAAAFGLASLLTMAAVSRRVAEFGTLKALGWRGRRIIGQVMGEALAIGVAGGTAGVALGFLGAELVSRLAPALTASGGPGSGSATPGLATGPGGAGPVTAGGPLGRALSGAAHTVSVSLTAPVTIGAVALAVVLAIAGGLVAGSFGGWRAARLRPAAALARVG